jgi:hypothetical protein
MRPYPCRKRRRLPGVLRHARMKPENAQNCRCGRCGGKPSSPTWPGGFAQRRPQGNRHRQEPERITRKAGGSAVMRIGRASKRIQEGGGGQHRDQHLGCPPRPRMFPGQPRRPDTDRNEEQRVIADQANRGVRDDRRDFGPERHSGPRGVEQ